MLFLPTLVDKSASDNASWLGMSGLNSYRHLLESSGRRPDYALLRRYTQGGYRAAAGLNCGAGSGCRFWLEIFTGWVSWNLGVRPPVIVGYNCAGFEEDHPW